jgi:hypothetical protein
MKLWHISQTVNRDYDTYDSAVVAAETEEAARMTHPNGNIEWGGTVPTWGSWAAAKYVTVEYLGEAREGHPPGVVCASFNAGWTP